ncbi:hypothetical protein A2U01_0085901, partial [Trifolium medium]|nr:hypothetical protein [Trifolium medium]
MKSNTELAGEGKMNGSSDDCIE